MTLRTRTELIQPKDQVALTVAFRDSTGMLVNPDFFPKISITEPNGMIVLSPTSQGVSQIDTGKFQYNFDIGWTGPYGVWSDIWSASINGFSSEATFNFVVNTTDQPALNTDAYVHLGDDPGFNFSQIAIFNINKLLKSLKRRLNGDGLVKTTDAFGNVQIVNCSIYSIDQLVTFIASSLTYFNQIPHFTFFTFEDTQFIEEFFEILVQGAQIEALFAQALIEKGKLANITDNGVSLQLPDLGELLNTQATTMQTQHYDKLKFIKNTFKPGPLGLAGYNMMGRNPTLRMLRALRERQII